jgi:hypothetical protein
MAIVISIQFTQYFKNLNPLLLYRYGFLHQQKKYKDGSSTGSSLCMNFRDYFRKVFLFLFFFSFYSNRFSILMLDIILTRLKEEIAIDGPSGFFFLDLKR